MTINLTWQQPDVLLCTVVGVPSSTDIKTFDWEIVQLLDQQQSVVHLIIDVSAMEQLPPLTAQRDLRWPRHPQIGRIFMVGHISMQWRVLLKVLGAVFRRSLYYESTIQAALQKLSI